MQNNRATEIKVKSGKFKNWSVTLERLCNCWNMSVCHYTNEILKFWYFLERNLKFQRKTIWFLTSKHQRNCREIVNRPKIKFWRENWNFCCFSPSSPFNSLLCWFNQMHINLRVLSCAKNNTEKLPICCHMSKSHKNSSHARSYMTKNQTISQLASRWAFSTQRKKLQTHSRIHHTWNSSRFAKYTANESDRPIEDGATSVRCVVVVNFLFCFNYFLFAFSFPLAASVKKLPSSCSDAILETSSWIVNKKSIVLWSFYFFCAN